MPRRTLAWSAISALAVSGLTAIAAPAQAAPAAAVTMISQLGGKASVRPDGADGADGAAATQYVDLVAVRRDSDATITFEVNADDAAGGSTAGWTAIPVTPVMTGNFAKASWDAQSAVGSVVSLRAVATTGDGASYSTVTGVAVTGVSVDESLEPHSVSVSPGRTGYFPQPYADSDRTATRIVVNGSSSAPTGTVELSWWRSSDGTFQGSTDAALTQTRYKVGPVSATSPSYTIGKFSEVLDITGYDAKASGDVLAVRGVRDSDGVTPIDVYQQSIEYIGADVSDDGAARSPQVSLTVADPDESSVIGAEVRRLSDRSVIGYTDRSGKVSTRQDAATSQSYYVNTTDNDAYEEGVDRITEVTTAEFVPAPTDIAPVLADGDHFDDDEYETGDIALQLLDQDGEPVLAAGEEVTYLLSGEGADEDGEAEAEPTVATTNEAGRVVIPFEPAASDGKQVLSYTGPESVSDGEWKTVELTSGDSRLTLTAEQADGTAPAGGSITYNGKMDLDGVPLAGRSIDLTYSRGTEALPGAAADAGIVAGDERVLAAAVTTDDDGKFTVTVADPAEPGNPGEDGGTLTATAVAAEETASASTTFTQGPPAPESPAPEPSVPTPSPETPIKAPVKVKLTGSSEGRAADKLVVDATRVAAGQRIVVFTKTGNGAWRAHAVRQLNSAGRVGLKLKDRSGKNVTSYRVELTASAAVAASTSNVKRLR